MGLVIGICPLCDAREMLEHDWDSDRKFQCPKCSGCSPVEDWHEAREDWAARIDARFKWEDRASFRGVDWRHCDACRKDVGDRVVRHCWGEPIHHGLCCDCFDSGWGSPE